MPNVITVSVAMVNVKAPSKWQVDKMSLHHQNVNELEIFCSKAFLVFFPNFFYQIFCPASDFIWQDSYLYNRFFPCFQSDTDVPRLDFKAFGCDNLML